VDDDFPNGVNGTAADPVGYIMTGLELANQNDTIYVYNGNYNDTVTVNLTTFNGTRLNIIGESESGVVLNASHELGFLIEGVHIRLANFTIEWSSTGIELRRCSGRLSNITVTSDPIDPTFGGFSVKRSDRLAIDNFETDDLVEMGMFYRSKMCSLSNSSSDYSSSETAHAGVSIVDSWGTIVENTTIESNQSAGFSVSGRYDNMIKQSLVVNGEAVHYYYDLHGTKDDFEGISGLTLIMDQVSTTGKITLANSTYVSIYDNDLNNQPYGSCIVLWNCQHIDVYNNTINKGSNSLGDSGITAIDSRDVYMYNMTLQHVYTGVRLRNTTKSLLANLTSMDNLFGVRIVEGGQNEIEFCGLSNNSQTGLALIDTSRNSVNYTLLNANKRYGFFIEGSYNNWISTSVTVNLEPVHYYNDVDSSISIDGLVLTNTKVSNVGKVTMYGSKDASITDCTLRNNEDGSGILLVESKNITVSGNSMRNNERGIALIDTFGCSLDDNDMDSYKYGLYVEARYDNWINRSNLANGESYSLRRGSRTSGRSRSSTLIS
jgi:parallel beta-helix repeat protein